MPPKRIADTETPSVNGSDSDEERSEERRKRQRTSSTQPWPDYNTWRQPVLTPEDRQKLKNWLDQKAAKNEEPFPITYPKPLPIKAGGKGKKGGPKKKSEKGLVRHESLKLDGREYGDVTFAITNRERWDQLTKYRRCTVSEQTFVLGACVFVNGESSSPGASEVDESLSWWKAQIHEVRALDENHVYLRVTWLARPAHDLDGLGAQPYHGKFELLPSTQMDIIDAKSINGPLNVKYWDEWQEEDVHNASEYFWRQSWDHIRKRLSPCRSMCACGQPQNPDQQIVQCNHCHEWLHAKCIEQDVLDKYLNNDKKAAAGVNGDAENGDTSHPKVKAKPKKPRSSKAAELVGKTEADGVTATLSIVSPQETVVTLTDSRTGRELEQESNVTCLRGQHSIDD